MRYWINKCSVFKINNQIMKWPTHKPLIPSIKFTALIKSKTQRIEKNKSALFKFKVSVDDIKFNSLIKTVSLIIKKNKRMNATNINLKFALISFRSSTRKIIKINKQDIIIDISRDNEICSFKNLTMK